MRFLIIILRILATITGSTFLSLLVLRGITTASDHEETERKKLNDRLRCSQCVPKQRFERVLLSSTEEHFGQTELVILGRQAKRHENHLYQNTIAKHPAPIGGIKNI